MTKAFPVASVRNPVERLTALFDTHYDRLYRLARRLVPCVDDALDLVQETYMRVARSPNAVPVGFRNEEAWLVRVLINIRRDQWRHAAVHDRINRNTKSNRSDTTSAGSNTEGVIIAHMTVWKALDKLPPRRRAVVVMHELEGLETSSIASLLGVSTITVRWHLSQGRRELARIINPEVLQHTGGIE
ncbi:MAG: RNA polymerase sigma factor [Sedimentisphaerales bacterium]|nr:RNA polymerase sigma factor [Sedimentisphaerales bacterium]